MLTNWSEVLLDLLNTTPVVDGVATDVLDADWLAAHHSEMDLAAVRDLRDELQRVVRGEVDAKVLNRHLVQVRRVAVVGDDGLTWALGGSIDWSARVVLAWGELQNDRPGRLRPCANGECHLFLVDRTRAGTARWCSMSGCGNRMKARRYYSRTVGRPRD